MDNKGQHKIQCIKMSEIVVNLTDVNRFKIIIV